MYFLIRAEEFNFSLMLKAIIFKLNLIIFFFRARRLNLLN